jgi:hypothetical protein
MKSLTISKKGATIRHDAVAAFTPDGSPVFILPANLPVAQLAVHPQGMIVYSVPAGEFPRYTEQLLASKGQCTFRLHGADRERLQMPHSELRAHGLDLAAADEKETG